MEAIELVSSDVDKRLNDLVADNKSLAKERSKYLSSTGKISKKSPNYNKVLDLNNKINNNSDIEGIKEVKANLSEAKEEVEKL